MRCSPLCPEHRGVKSTLHKHWCQICFNLMLSTLENLIWIAQQVSASVIEFSSQKDMTIPPLYVWVTPQWLLTLLTHSSLLLCTLLHIVTGWRKIIPIFLLAWVMLQSTNICILWYYPTGPVNDTVTMNASIAFTLTNITGIRVTWSARVNANTEYQNGSLCSLKNEDKWAICFSQIPYFETSSFTL